MSARNILILITGIGLLSGCMSQKKPADKYYVIEKTDSLEIFTPSEQPFLEDYCEVVPVEVYPPYASRKIAKKNKSHEIIYYRYHRWAVRPGETLNLMIEDHMNRTSLFKRVSRRYWRINPAYRIETTVYQLEILEKEKALQAHAWVRFNLFHIPSNDLVVTHEANRFENLHQKDINLFAKTIGDILHEELNEFSRKIMQQKQNQQQTIDK